MKPILRARGIGKVYGTRGSSFAALDGVDLDVDAGEFTGIMGPSGSGKTTLLNLLSAIDRPTAGSILFEGRDLETMTGAELAAFRRDRLGFVFQDFNLIDTLTVRENIVLPLALAGRPAAAQAAACDKRAGELGIRDALDKYPTEISGGQKQRAAAARALVAEPALVLADEPTGNLDSASSEQLWTLLGELARERAITVLMVTHEPAAAAHCRRVFVLKDGQVTGTIESEGLDAGGVAARYQQCVGAA